MGDLHALLRASRATGLDLARLVTRGWPRLDKEGCYRGPLPRHCGHDHSASLPLPGYPASLCQALARLAWATVDSSPASTMGGSSFQRAGKDTSENALAASSDSLPSSDPEAVAASLHVPTKQQILDIFEMLPSDDPPRGQLQAGSKAFTVGSYAVGGGLLGVRKATRSYPEVAKLLCRFVESLKQGFEFMAVALFRDLRTLPHRDLGNQQGTCNLVAGLSDFRAGGVWVSSESGAVPCPIEGFSECGDVLPVSGTLAIFDPRHLHCTMEWQGSRVVLVAYCPFLGERMADADLDFLVSFGVFGRRDRSAVRIGLLLSVCLRTMMMLLDLATSGARCLRLNQTTTSPTTARRAALRMRMKTATPSQLMVWANWAGVLH